MAESQSLLAHLTPWFYRPIEDRGTDALAYILNRSAACRAVLDNLLRDDGFSPEPATTFKTQVQYDGGKSRIDMIGYVEGGNVATVVESKFWAGLQPDQTCRYFAILQDETSRPGTLLVVCPKSRERYLWPEVQSQMEKCGWKMVLIDSPAGTQAAEVTNTNKRCVMVSWEALVDKLDAAAENFAVRADVHQLRGLVQQQNDEAFPPLTTETTGHGFALLDDHFRRMVGNAVQRGKREFGLNTKGLQWGVTKQYRRRFFKVGGVREPRWLTLGIEYREEFFGKTPLWVMIPLKHSPKIKPVVGEIRDQEHCWLPITLKTGAVYDDVLDDVVAQLMAITDYFDRAP
ncbi:MAG: hypothetical protein F4Y69_04980 [Chloroflexi bacterium]|nr:hypothetical protein [Chloroflexota bacterium]MYF21614.1 hypothetical protein [Chloroflexota bacterium]